jgi:hypothetical protein
MGDRRINMASSLASSIASAITQVENTNPSLNNPGGIMDYNYYKQTGQFRLQQYPSLEAGQDALLNLTQKYVDQGNTLDSFFGNYAPYGHGNNDPAVYAQTVSSKIGIPTDVPLNTISSNGPIPSVTSTISYPSADVVTSGESSFSGDDTSLASLLSTSNLDTSDSNISSLGVLGLIAGVGIIAYMIWDK